MWTSTMDLDLKKVLLTQIIGLVYRDIYFSSYSPLQVQNLPRQSLPESTWIRVRNRLSGICGSDLHLLYGDGDLNIAPAAVPNHKHTYPGHEVVGEVIEIGDTVQNLRVGDRVVLQSGPNCVSGGVQPLCRACLTGNYNLCEQSFITPQPIGGGWSEEMLLHEQQLYRVPSTLSDEQAVMLEPTAVAIHSILRRVPKPGEKVLIIGAGTIGLMTLQVLRALAPQTEISVMARHPFQVEQATRLGAAHIIYPHDAYIGIQRATRAKLYRGLLGNQILFGGYDTIYDTIGRRKTLHHALRWVRAQGAVVLVGSDMHLTRNIDLSPLWYQEVDLLGSTSHGMETWPLGTTQHTSTFDIAAELIEQKHIVPEQLITHHFALDNYKHALLTATKKADSRAIKVVFDYSLLPASVVPNVRASAPRRRRPSIDFSEYVNDLPEDIEQEQEVQLVPIDKAQDVKLRQSATPEMQDLPPTPAITPTTGEWPRKTYKDESSDDETDKTANALPAINQQRQSPQTPLPHIPQSQIQEERAVQKQPELVTTAVDEQDEAFDKTQRFDRAALRSAIAHTNAQQAAEQEEELTQSEESTDATQLFSREALKQGSQQFPRVPDTHADFQSQSQTNVDQDDIPATETETPVEEVPLHETVHPDDASEILEASVEPDASIEASVDESESLPRPADEEREVPLTGYIQHGLDTIEPDEEQSTSSISLPEESSDLAVKENERNKNIQIISDETATSSTLEAVEQFPDESLEVVAEPVAEETPSDSEQSEEQALDESNEVATEASGDSNELAVEEALSENQEPVSELPDESNELAVEEALSENHEPVSELPDENNELAVEEALSENHEPVSEPTLDDSEQSGEQAMDESNEAGEETSDNSQEPIETKTQADTFQKKKSPTPKRTSSTRQSSRKKKSGRH